jgi:hypothetical protein
MQEDMDKYIKLNNRTWNTECQKHNCSEIVKVINENINTALLVQDVSI